MPSTNGDATASDPIDAVVGWRDVGLWQPADRRTVVDLCHDRPRLFDGDVTWPAMVLKDVALQHNIATLADFCKQHDLLFAPHGKTTMAPALFARQLDAGAWGITVATANQAMIAVMAGVRTVLLANEVLDGGPLEWFADRQRKHSGLTFMHYVDSTAGVDVASSAATRAGGTLSVLVDVGYPGGRTGCRSAAAAAQLASAVDAAAGLELVGVAGYEGGLTDATSVAAYLDGVHDVAVSLHASGLLADDAIVTAGGSAWFDVVGERWGRRWPDGFTPRRVLRSGAYLTHDDGVYTSKTPFLRIAGELVAALEVWAQVISPGDPGRVIVGMGKRDAPYDEGLPIPLKVRRRGSEVVSDLVDAVVEKMDDHHAYLVGDADLQPGDLVAFGISHPCTAFDKWQVLPVVDAEYRLVDVVRTHF